MELLIIVSLVLLNGVFAMAEMALVSSRRFKLKNAQVKGSKSARIALALSDNPTRFLSTVQIGITLIGILLGVYSGENLTNDVSAFLEQFDPIRPYAHNIAIAVIVVFVTYVSIVLGELLPKRIGLIFPEPIAMLLAQPMRLLSVLTSPFVWLLTTSNDVLLKIFGIKNIVYRKISEEEIKALVRESAAGGEIRDIEQNIVERVFELGDRKVNSLMTHRTDLVYLDENDSLAAVRRKAGREKHSAYPVCRANDIDNILGIVLLEDLFDATSELGFSLKGYMKKPFFINETMAAYKLLDLFMKSRLHYAIIVDEFGATQGMATMDDVLDALVGDASELHEEEYGIKQRDENSWLVDGQYPVSEFLKYFKLQFEPAQQGQFVTVAGLLLHKSNALPQVGDRFEFNGYWLEVVDKDGQRIDKVLVTRN